ncbi:hypothetical protein ABZ807_23035 [Micromonospora sp. NPDC047548]
MIVSAVRQQAGVSGRPLGQVQLATQPPHVRVLFSWLSARTQRE